jgi:hypothetical protein
MQRITRPSRIFLILVSIVRPLYLVLPMLITQHDPQVVSATLFLIPDAYNPLTSALSSYKTTPNTVPLTYYDYRGAYGGNRTHAGVSPTVASPRPRENATLVMLASNSDVNSVVRSVYELEDRFNSKYNYPWIFLNNEQFSDEFKSYASVLFSFPLLPVSPYPNRVLATQVACRLSRQGLSTLGRSLKSIGISLRG